MKKKNPDTRYLAALLVAQDKLSIVQIAKRCDVSVRTIENWKHEAEFQNLVSGHLNAWKNHVFQAGIADKRRRVFRLNDRWRRLQSVIEKRAGDPAMAAIPGGKTGLLRRVNKATGTDYVVDYGLVAALNATERQAAEELGQLNDKNLKPVRRLSDLTEAELEALVDDCVREYGPEAVRG